MAQMTRWAATLLVVALARIVGVLCLLSMPFLAMAQATPDGADAPLPVELPRDDGAHPEASIEWWYFTGHLFTRGGERFGFEYVVFRARQGELEGYVSHFAVTDNARGTFRYDEKIMGTPGVAGNGALLDLNLDGWQMSGGNGRFALGAAMPDYALRLHVAATKPPTLHDGDGYVDYGDGTGSYYYSWTRMEATGAIRLGDTWTPVTGEVWMDHQWGKFATYENGGWDWYALQLGDGTDVMLYLIRDQEGGIMRVDGSVVGAAGEVRLLREGDFTVTATGAWTSAATGATYPSGWRVVAPGAGLDLTLTPTMVDQELDTRRTTGVIYWEGEVAVAGARGGQPIEGLGYVELTGYAPVVDVDLEQVATPVR
jgi:predicted secreted hydrolase